MAHSPPGSIMSRTLDGKGDDLVPISVAICVENSHVQATKNGGDALRAVSNVSVGDTPCWSDTSRDAHRHKEANLWALLVVRYLGRARGQVCLSNDLILQLSEPHISIVFSTVDHVTCSKEDLDLDTLARCLADLGPSWRAGARTQLLAAHLPRKGNRGVSAMYGPG